MFLNSPIWLILLVPWLALTIWLLMGRLETQRVSFLQLWDREIGENRRPRRAWSWPPVGLIALLAGILAAIVGAAGPMIGVRENSTPVATRSRDVRIEYLAVAAGPTTQAMIRLCNRSDLTAAKVIAHAGDAAVSQEIDLPALGQTRNYFVDLPMAASTIDAEVLADDGRIDHHLQINRRASWPIVEARGSLSPALIRMIDVYSRNRRPGEGSKHIAVSMASDHLDADEPTAIVMDTRSGSQRTSDGVVTVLQSPLTASVDWNSALSGARIEGIASSVENAKNPHPILRKLTEDRARGKEEGTGERPVVRIQSLAAGDWRPVVSVEGKAVLAVREEPVRQVWVGFTSDDFPHRPDFVILWSNIFSWLGYGGEEYPPAISPADGPNSAAKPVAEPAKSVGGRMFFLALGLTIFAAGAWKRPKIPQRNDVKC